MISSFKKLLAIASAAAMLLPAVALAGGPSTDLGLTADMEVKIKAEGGINFGNKHGLMSGKGEVLSVGDATLTVKDKNDAQVTFVTNDRSRLQFRGGRLSMLSLVHPGDRVMFRAQKNDKNEWVLRHLVDFSLKRGTVQGTAKNVSGLSFDVDAGDRGMFHVTANEKTAFRWNKETPATSADLTNDTKVTVKGVLHVETKAINDVKFVILHVGEDEEETPATSSGDTSGSTTTP